MDELLGPRDWCFVILLSFVISDPAPSVASVENLLCITKTKK